MVQHVLRILKMKIFGSLVTMFEDITMLLIRTLLTPAIVHILWLAHATSVVGFCLVFFIAHIVSDI